MHYEVFCAYKQRGPQIEGAVLCAFTAADVWSRFLRSWLVSCIQLSETDPISGRALIVDWEFRNSDL